MSLIDPRFLFASITMLLVGQLDAAISMPAFEDPQGEVVRLEYFLDVDPGFGRGTLIPFTLDDDGRVRAKIRSLAVGHRVGVRTLYVRAMNQRGVWGVPARHTIHVGPIAVVERPRILRGEYFFGDDPGFGKGTPISLPEIGSSNRLELGIVLEGGRASSEVFHVRFQDSLGNWSLPAEGVVVLRPHLPVTEIEWAVVEGERHLTDGTLPINPPQTMFSRLIPTELLGDEDLLGRELTVSARLILGGRIPTQSRAETFTIESLSDEILMLSDRDGDGLLDVVETNSGVFLSQDDTGTDPDNPDSDSDGIPDGVEVNWPMRPNHEDSELLQFFANRLHHLSLGVPLVQRDEDGRFVIRIRIDESTDLERWRPVEIAEDALGTEQGDVVVTIESRDREALFFLLRGLGD